MPVVLCRGRAEKTRSAPPRQQHPCLTSASPERNSGFPAYFIPRASRYGLHTTTGIFDAQALKRGGGSRGQARGKRSQATTATVKIPTPVPTPPPVRNPPVAPLPVADRLSTPRTPSSRLRQVTSNRISLLPVRREQARPVSSAQRSVSARDNEVSPGSTLLRLFGGYCQCLGSLALARAALGR